MYSGGGTGTAVETVVSSGGSLTSAVLNPGDVVTVEAGGVSYFTSAIKPPEAGQVFYPTPDMDSRENVSGLSVSGAFSAYVSAAGNEGVV